MKKEKQNYVSIFIFFISPSSGYMTQSIFSKFKEFSSDIQCVYKNCGGTKQCVFVEVQTEKSDRNLAVIRTGLVTR